MSYATFGAMVGETILALNAIADLTNDYSREVIIEEYVALAKSWIKRANTIEMTPEEYLEFLETLTFFRYK